MRVTISTTLPSCVARTPVLPASNDGANFVHQNVIPRVSHEGIQFDSDGNMYFIDDHSTTGWFTPIVPNDGAAQAAAKAPAKPSRTKIDGPNFYRTPSDREASPLYRADDPFSALNETTPSAGGSSTRSSP